MPRCLVVNEINSIGFAALNLSYILHMRTETELADLHKKSRLNRSWLIKSNVCGCFYCFAEFPFDQIVKWIDGGETAICPHCSIDSVLGFAAAADHGLLRQMHERWFKTSMRLTPEEWKKAVEKNAWARAPAKAPGRK